MIHISPTKKGFQVSVVSDENGRLIQSSKGLDSKRACMVNIKAFADEVNGDIVHVQDNTLKKPKVFILAKNWLDKWVREKSEVKPVKPYMPR